MFTKRLQAELIISRKWHHQAISLNGKSGDCSTSLQLPSMNFVCSAGSALIQSYMVLQPEDRRAKFKSNMRHIILTT